MRGAYSRASVVALALKPNLHLSGLSVLLEAMACSRPVVITDSPGLQEYVTDGENGIVVQPGDPDALAAGVGELLADPDRARAIGGAGKGGNPGALHDDQAGRADRRDPRQRRLTASGSTVDISAR